MDKYIAKRTANLPDYRDEVTKQLPAGEAVHGFTFGRHAASDGTLEDETGVSDWRLQSAQSRVINSAINSGIKQVKKAKHITGEDGSIARTWPRNGDQRALVLTDRSLSLWSFGFQMRTVPPTLSNSVDRDQLTQIEKLSGPRGAAGRGMATARLHFVDGSSVDYIVIDHETYADFWTAAASVSSPSPRP